MASDSLQPSELDLFARNFAPHFETFGPRMPKFVAPCASCQCVVAERGKLQFQAELSW